MNAFIILFDEEWQFYHSDHVGNGDHVSLKIKGGVKIFLKVQERIFLIFQDMTSLICKDAISDGDHCPCI